MMSAPMVAVELRKNSRREVLGVHNCADFVHMARVSSRKLFGGRMNRRADSDVGSAPADIAIHGVSISVSVGFIFRDSKPIADMI